MAAAARLRGGGCAVSKASGAAERAPRDRQDVSGDDRSLSHLDARGMPLTKQEQQTLAPPPTAMEPAPSTYEAEAPTVDSGGESERVPLALDSVAMHSDVWARTAPATSASPLSYVGAFVADTSHRLIRQATSAIHAFVSGEGGELADDDSTSRAAASAAGQMAHARHDADEEEISGSKLPEETRKILTVLDDRLVEVLKKGDIRLVRAKWLLALPKGKRLVRRQELRAIDQIEPLLTPREAVAAVRDGNRGVGALSHPWMSPVCSEMPHCTCDRHCRAILFSHDRARVLPRQGDPDPGGHRLRTLQDALRKNEHIVAVFFECAARPAWSARLPACSLLTPLLRPTHPCLPSSLAPLSSLAFRHMLCVCVFAPNTSFCSFASLPQQPRSTEENEMMKRALACMGDLYASAIGTTVLQSKDIFQMPETFEGALCLFGVHAGVDEAAVRAVVHKFGESVTVDLGATPPIVRFATHAAALRAKEDAELASICEGVDMRYNQRPYDGRGWCTFEGEVSCELEARLSVNPRMRDALACLPPKMLALHSNADPTPIEVDAGALKGRVERVVAAIESATFTGKGDKPMVVQLYKDYVRRIADVLQPLLARLRHGEHVAASLPQISADATFEAVRAQYVQWMRAQHATIADALSGDRLDARSECVPIAIAGKDPTGRDLSSVRDAVGLSAWLPTLRGAAAPCVLLTAGPASGKTWLMSQVIVHLTDDVLPLLVRAEQLQQYLRRDAFAAADDWIDAYLQRAYELPYAAMLRSVWEEGKAILLLDGLDEAGAERARLEEHIATRLAPQGRALMCTSRPAGLDEARFAGFHRLKLAPLSDAQQREFLLHRCGAARGAELSPA